MISSSFAQEDAFQMNLQLFLLHLGLCSSEVAGDTNSVPVR